MLNRNILTLVAAQLVSVAGVVAMVTLGGILGQRFAPSPALATLPISFQVLGTAAATVGAAWLMSRIGRARGFAIGALIGCGGYLLAVASLATESFVMLIGAAALNGIAAAFAQQYRFAAVESVPDRPGPAVSLVLTGSLGGAIVGPGLVAWGEGWIPEIRFAGAFVAIAACYLAVVPMLARLRTESAEQPRHDHAARPLAAIAGQPVFLAAVVGGVAGYGAMTFVMTAAPLSMHIVDGHSLSASATVIQGHVLGMYLPSLATGILIMRFGAGRMMALGVLVLAATLAIGLGRSRVPALHGSDDRLGHRLELPLHWRHCAAQPDAHSGRALSGASLQRLQRLRRIGPRLVERRRGHACVRLERGAGGCRRARCSGNGHAGLGAPGSSVDRSGDMRNLVEPAGIEPATSTMPL